ncbi:hypothetical protein HF521_011029 [Silurus meridionalis]|uniref:FXYD domain-containing ion transport regulator n=1 Tax=Silurus meridionalis TaxID=175797 RepID=A0A8T0AHX1_SILME|nr:hypothetical protein HF521_011029 [Silurus meridionalis]
MFQLQGSYLRTVHLKDFTSCATRKQEPGKDEPFLTAFFSALFSDAEANPFVYNYDRLRIGGIVFTVLLVIGAIFLLFHDKCGRKKKNDDAASQI